MTYHPQDRYLQRTDEAEYQRFAAEVLSGDQRSYQDPAGKDESPASDYRAGGFFGIGEMVRIAAESDAPLSEDEQIKADLLEQNDAEHFRDPDPTDGLTDDALWEATPKPWRSDG